MSIKNEIDYPNSSIDIKKEIKNVANFSDCFKVFLCPDTIENVKQFIEDTNGFRKNTPEVKELWKKLIIDSISALKINDVREKLNETPSPEPYLNEKVESIRDLNSYGIEELDKYFDDFVEFESVLYGSDSHYRDHVNHVIQVWLIGLLLLCKDGNLKHLKFNDNMKYVDKSFSSNILSEKDFKIIDKKNEVALYVTKSEVLSMWTIIALCHDLGYPLEKASNINQNLKNILSHFGSLNIQEFSYNFNILNNHLVEKYLNIVSSKVLICNQNKTINNRKFYKQKKNIRNVGITSIQSKYRDKISKSLEDSKHGVLSGLLIFKTLTYFLETDFTYPNNEPLPYEDLRQFSIRKEILRAITAHTCPKLYHLDVRNFSFLLILCDELHEWERPRFEDLKNGPLSDHDEMVEVYLDQFYFDEAKIKKVESEKDLKALIRVRFVDKSGNLTKNPIEIEKKIDRKFQTLHHLLRSAKDDNLRQFLFRWKYEYPNKDNSNNSNDESDFSYIYRFRFDSSLDVYNSINATAYIVKNKKTIDCPESVFSIYRKITKPTDTSMSKLKKLL